MQDTPFFGTTRVRRSGSRGGKSGLMRMPLLVGRLLSPGKLEGVAHVASARRGVATHGHDSFDYSSYVRLHCFRCAAILREHPREGLVLRQIPDPTVADVAHDVHRRLRF